MLVGATTVEDPVDPDLGAVKTEEDQIGATRQTPKSEGRETGVFRSYGALCKLGKALDRLQ